MIWLTWRQFRIQAYVAAFLMAAVVAFVLVVAPRVFDLYRSTGLSAGTHRLVWNQTVSRRRWLGVKLAGIGLVAVLSAGLLSLAVTWFSLPFDRAGDLGRVSPVLFSSRGVAPLGYALLAFVGGVTIGMVTRRLLAAMAATLVFVAPAQLASPFLFREHLVAPVASSSAFAEGRIKSLYINPENRVHIELQAPERGAWVVSNVTVGPDGKEFTGPVDADNCGPKGSADKCHAWLASKNLTQKIEYVPAERFWALQWRELGLLVVVTGLLSVFCLWWIRRWVT